MKVGILTFPNSSSYGAALQMFALYQTCRDLGYDAEIVNYFNLWMKQMKHVTVGQGKGKALLWGKRKANDLLHICMKARFARFEKQMHKYPRKAVSDPAQLSLLAKRYGAVICGSDQVWNPDITGEDLSYFLNFCGEETARVSYAPSFGVEALAGQYAQKVRRELEAFDHLSIREEVGQRMIRDLAGLDAKLVVDPTFLLDAAMWQKYEQPHPQAKGAYILYYTVRSSKTLWKHCLSLARKTNMKILRVGSNVVSKYLKKVDGVEDVCDIGPGQWLYLMRNASYVVTNSFHGTAFSINYGKNFYVEFSSATNSRLSNIVKLLGLEDRVVYEDTDIAASAADYGVTAAVLPQMKAESLAFLADALHSARMKQENTNE